MTIRPEGGDKLLEDLVHEFPVELAGDHIETTLPAHSVAFLLQRSIVACAAVVA
jgi:hypothetical protein